jgi:putative transposase
MKILAHAAAAMFAGLGILHLAMVLDLFSRKIVGWAISDRMKKDLAKEALQRALTMRRPEPDLIHHSECGS